MSELFNTILIYPLTNILLLFSQGFWGYFGLGVIALTIIVRILIFPMSWKQLQVQKVMTALQPKMKELQKKYGKDKRKLSEETMKLYQEHKISPLGCVLPMLIQVPIFISLYFSVQHVVIAIPDVSAVGNSGAILRYDGSDWSSVISGTTNTLNGVWGSSSSDVFAVGSNGIILRYNGNDWTALTDADIPNQNLNSVWGSSSSDVFAVGSNGTILRYNGNDWTALISGTTNTLNGVWGSSSSDVFAVGSNGTILRYNGSDWTALTDADIPNQNLNSVWGSSSSDVFAVGSNGTILRYNGNDWTALTDADIPNQNLNSVWGSSSSDVFAVGSNGTILRYNGNDWTALISGTTNTLNGVWGSSSSDVFAVGSNGTILRYNGSDWTALTDADIPNQNLNSVWGNSSSVEGIYSWSVVHQRFPNMNFLWMNLGNSGDFPLALLVMFSMYVVMKMGGTGGFGGGGGSMTSADPKQAQLQRIMVLIFPLMLGFITVSLPSGVGLYFVVSNIIGIILQYFVTGWGALQLPPPIRERIPVDRLPSWMRRTGTANPSPPTIRQGAEDGKHREKRQNSGGGN